MPGYHLKHSGNLFFVLRLIQSSIPVFLLVVSAGWVAPSDSPRERISIDEHWRFTRGDPTNNTASLLYDVRREQSIRRFAAEADGNPALNQSVVTNESTNTTTVIKQWILPTGNDFITDASRKSVRPAGNFGDDLAYVRRDFDDSQWQWVDLPHDWAIAGPFSHSGAGGMGRLPTAGVGWYRKQLDIPAADAGKMIYLDVDGAMSYAVVWLNGQLVGGWPYGYASWRVDLTPYVNPGGTNELAIRLDNPPNSSRWYPGAGIYRNVWLVKTAPVHVGHWGTYITTPMVSSSSATVDLKVTVDNDSKQDAKVSVSTLIFPLNADGEQTGAAVAEMATLTLSIPAGSSAVAAGATTVADPKLWGPPPQQRPNRYVAVTTLKQGDKVVDVYETPFGIRTIRFDPNEGFFINERVHTLERRVRSP